MIYNLYEPKLSTNFGNYKSFLEISFGTNLLFGVWDGLTKKMLDWRVKQVSSLHSKINPSVVDVASTREKSCNSFCDTVKMIGRVIGIIFSCIIAMTLFVFGDDAKIGGWGLFFIMMSAMPLPMSFLLIVERSGWMVLHNWISFKDFPSSPKVVERAENASKGLDDLPPPYRDDDGLPF